MDNLAIERLNTCKECPLYSIRYGGMCNSRLWLNPETNDISDTKKEGYIRGCGCILESKVKGESGTCPAGKW